MGRGDREVIAPFVFLASCNVPERLGSLATREIRC